MISSDSNLVQAFLNQARIHPCQSALLYRSKTAGKFLSISWREFQSNVEKTSLALYALGIRPGDRVGILSENRPEWVMADFGILSLGAVVVPIYPTSSVQDVAHLVQDAGIKVLFLSTGDHRARLASFFDTDSQVKKIIYFEKPFPRPLDKNELLYSDFLERGRWEKFNSPNLYQELTSVIKSDHLATLIYTSGTTGAPKGVMLTHRNFLENAKGASERIHVSASDRALSFLPLSHVFERLAGYYFMLTHGAAIAYAQSMLSVVDDMKEIRPTVACAVPRFYEKFYARIMEKAAHLSGLRKKIFFWAIAVGKKRVKLKDQKPSFSMKFQQRIASLLVFNKIKSQLGGRMRFFISGSAPLSAELAEFFYSLDILILEGYGLTETSPVIAVNCPEDFKFGTVGKPLSNVQVKIAEDGEILTKGPCVMQGYFQNPEATKEVMKDGWFHTGDIGMFTDEGFLKITDRKKDIIKTSGGKMISPQNIEGMILTDPLFSQVVVIGDKRNYLVALLVPSRTVVEDHARELGIDISIWSEVLSHPAIHAWIDARFREKTHGLASFEQIKYYALLPTEFSLAAGELTPTLKIKRRVVCEKYKEVIDELYRKGEAPASRPVRG